MFILIIDIKFECTNYEAKSNQPVIIYLVPLLRTDPVCACVHSAGHIKVLFASGFI